MAAHVHKATASINLPSWKLQPRLNDSQDYRIAFFCVVDIHRPAHIWADIGDDMRKFLFTVAGVCLLSLGAGSAQAQTVGDWVLGNFQGSGYWFPGVIASVAGDKVTVRYDDGDVETVYANAVRPYDWSVGKRVECNFQGTGDWYAGKITSLSGERLSIAYDDGDKETTKTGRCRSR